MEAQFLRELEKIESISRQITLQEQELNAAWEEKTVTLSTLVAESWMAKTFPEKYGNTLDPLLTKKFKTKAGYSSIRLEKLLLELDKVDTLGNEELRSRRKAEVSRVQTLLKRADELSSKASRLVIFQDSLADIGKRTLRKTLEEPSQNIPVSLELDTSANPHAERRFAQPASVNKDGTKMEIETTERSHSVVPEPIVKDSENTTDSISESDSHEDLMASVEERERKAREFYMKHHDQDDSKLKRFHRERTDDEEKEITSKEEITSNPRDSNASQKGLHSQRPSPPLSRMNDELQEREPVVEIREMPRAYVMRVKDPHATYARVSIGEDGLTIAVPKKKPVTFGLGSNINTRAITKETQGNILQIVLPKIPRQPVSQRHPRSNFGIGNQFGPWGGLIDPFTSRF